MTLQIGDVLRTRAKIVTARCVLVFVMRLEEVDEQRGIRRQLVAANHPRLAPVAYLTPAVCQHMQSIQTTDAVMSVRALG